jgi:hypothetical protein
MMPMFRPGSRFSKFIGWTVRGVLGAHVLCFAMSIGCDARPANPPELVLVSSRGASFDKSDLVDVPDEGRKFDPPIEKTRLPGGVWYCDMGAVHWAQRREGTRQCPLCKMELRRKGVDAH